MKTTDPNAVLIHVFGCQMNKLDGELIRSVLHEEGYRFTDRQEEAGIVLFVTCSVREHAEARVHSRLGALKQWKRSNPDAILGLMGCMAQKDGEKLIRQHPHLDLVVGTRDFPRIPEILERAKAGERGLTSVDLDQSPSVKRKEGLRPHKFKAFLSIMRGCDRYCSYCVVPYVRGREESRPLEDVLEEARRLIDDGVLEITLLGQTVNHYDDGRGNRLPDLLRRLDALPGLKRLGFITSYPAFVDQPLVEAIADCPRVLRCLHLPAQSGSDRILKRMNRRYTASDYLDVIASLREAVPDMELASDFIVGFPGESEEDYLATERLMEDVRFQQSFIFKYSPRPGTLAAKKYPDDIPRAVKEERNARLLKLQERIGREKNREWVGRTVDVLVEGRSKRDPDRYTGRTVWNQIAAFPASPGMVGRMIPVKIASATALTLLGEVVEEAVS